MFVWYNGVQKPKKYKTKSKTKSKTLVWHASSSKIPLRSLDELTKALDTTCSTMRVWTSYERALQECPSFGMISKFKSSGAPVINYGGAEYAVNTGYKAMIKEETGHEISGNGYNSLYYRDLEGNPQKMNTIMNGSMLYRTEVNFENVEPY